MYKHKRRQSIQENIQLYLDYEIEELWQIVT